LKLRILLFLVSLVVLVLSSCNQPQPTASQPSPGAEPKLFIKALSSNLPLNTWFPVEVTVENAPALQEFPVSVFGVGDIFAEVPTATLKTDANGVGKFTTNAKATKANHVSLIASVAIESENLSESLEIVFDSPSTGFAALAVGATEDTGQTVAIEEYYESIPVVSDSNYATIAESDTAVLKDSEGQEIAGRPSTVIVENIQYIGLDGNLTEPVSGIEYALSTTGAGDPKPEDLPADETPLTDTLPTDTPAFSALQSDPVITAQAAYCGTSTTRILFRQVVDYNYAVNPPARIYGNMPEGTYFRAVDNAVFTDPILYEGYVGSGGWATFSYPNCDPAGGGKPDVYFIFETRNHRGLTASHGTVTRRHWWRTDTYWDYAPSQFNNRMITAIGDNAEAINTQRLWYKVNQVYNWNQSA
jgi:hypothetical protein